MDTDKFKNEYPGLSTISIICKIIGNVIIFIAILVLIYGLTLLRENGDERQLGIYLIISSIVSGLILSILFFAFSELIKLFVRIEFNTRNDKDDEKTKRSRNNDISYEDWKKDNPTKTLNDFYDMIQNQNQK